MKLRKYTPSMLGLGLVLVLALGGHVHRSAAAPGAPLTTDANITRLTTSLLEHTQVERRPFDAALARTLVDRYVDALDGTRSLFLQSDVDEFSAHDVRLAEDMRQAGDTGAAQAIFGRYLERMQERASFVTDALRTGTFDFSGHDRYVFDREDAARPRDRTAARALWRQRLRAEYLQEKLEGHTPAQIAGTLSHRYAQQLRTMKNLHHDDVLAIYLDTLAHVYDPHSDYLGHEQMESFSIAMNLSLVGIGATLEDADGYCKVRELVPGGPAARSGVLRPGDRIVAVAQAGKEPVDVVSMPLSHVVELIRGPKGSTVRLAVIPATAPDGSPARTESIVRDDVRLEEQEAKASIVDLPTPAGATRRLGVIDLPSLYAGGKDERSATADVARLLGKLEAEHVQGVVLDLRHDGGGSLDEAIRLTGLFIAEGPVVQTRDQAGHITVGADTDPTVAYDGPLVVLTSRFSASASEILAGALQDYGRALIVGGTSTFGKGTVQTLVPLGRVMDGMGLAHDYDPGALKVTISQFYRPGGASTQLRGVASDIVLPSPDDLGRVGESTLKSALAWDGVAPARYSSLHRVAPYVVALRRRSAERVAADAGLRELAGDTARVKARLATKSLSLDEADRRRELTEDKSRRDARESPSPAGAAGWATYPVTLENLSSPGLPPPLAASTRESRAPAAPGDRPDGEALDSMMSEPRADALVLGETERILADYVDLVSKRDMAKASAR